MKEFIDPKDDNWTYSQGQRKALFAKCEKEKLQNKVPASKLKRF